MNSSDISGKCLVLLILDLLINAIKHCVLFCEHLLLLSMFLRLCYCTCEQFVPLYCYYSIVDIYYNLFIHSSMDIDGHGYCVFSSLELGTKLI